MSEELVKATRSNIADLVNLSFKIVTQTGENQLIIEYASLLEKILKSLNILNLKYELPLTALEDFKEILRIIKLSLENNDWVQLCDVSFFELKKIKEVLVKL